MKSRKEASKKEIIIIAGANGTGKTTFAKTYIKRYRYDFVNADEIAGELVGEPGKKRDFAAGEIFFERVEAIIKENRSLIIESTLAGKYLLNLIHDVKERGYFITIIYIFLETPELCIERIKERLLKGGHHVLDADVIRRYHRSRKNFWKLYKNLADKWYLVHNAKWDFVRIAMGQGLKGKFVVNHSQLFDIFLKDVV